MTKIQRSFKCRNEELVPIAKFTSFSLKRDLNEISQVYNNVNPDYIAATNALIANVENLLEPQVEMLAMKQVTKELNESMNDLLTQINFLATYLKMSHKALKISVTDFGLTNLRKAIYKSDAEAVVENLKIVLIHTKQNSNVLQANGMSSNFVEKLEALNTKIAADRQKQFELLRNRMLIVQDNTQMLNQLYSRILEIHLIGKSIFAKTNAVKLDDYTFKKLLSKVRQTVKAKKATTEEVNAENSENK